MFRARSAARAVKAASASSCGRAPSARRPRKSAPPRSSARAAPMSEQICSATCGEPPLDRGLGDRRLGGRSASSWLRGPEQAASSTTARTEGAYASASAAAEERRVQCDSALNSLDHGGTANHDHDARQDEQDHRHGQEHRQPRRALLESGQRSPGAFRRPARAWHPTAGCRTARSAPAWWPAGAGSPAPVRSPSRCSGDPAVGHDLHLVGGQRELAARSRDGRSGSRSATRAIAGSRPNPAWAQITSMSSASGRPRSSLRAVSGADACDDLVRSQQPGHRRGADDDVAHHRRHRRRAATGTPGRSTPTSSRILLPTNRPSALSARNPEVTSVCSRSAERALPTTARCARWPAPARPPGASGEMPVGAAAAAATPRPRASPPARRAPRSRRIRPQQQQRRAAQHRRRTCRRRPAASARGS